MCAYTCTHAYTGLSNATTLHANGAVRAKWPHSTPLAEEDDTEAGFYADSARALVASGNHKIALLMVPFASWLEEHRQDGKKSVCGCVCALFYAPDDAPQDETIAGLFHEHISWPCWPYHAVFFFGARIKCQHETRITVNIPF